MWSGLSRNPRRVNVRCADRVCDMEVMLDEANTWIEFEWTDTAAAPDAAAGEVAA